jgi:hypothetical protein
LCAEECAQHDKMDHCRECAAACRHCAEECRRMVTAASGARRDAQSRRQSAH